jgi:predicted nucleotidyltransferase
MSTFLLSYFSTFSAIYLEVSKKLPIFAHGTLNIMIMSTQTMTQLIAEYFKTQPVLKAWIFGSYARGEETPESDVDILVEFDKDARVSLMKHAGMIVDLEQKLNRPIDLVVNGTLLPFARKSADRDKIMIYERAS